MKGEAHSGHSGVHSTASTGSPVPDSALTLRRRAEAIRSEKTSIPEDLKALTREEFERTLHELRVHQIELEIQNEELRRTQEELEASRARYFDLYHLAPVGYLTLSETGLILEANLAAAKLLGVTRDALVQQPLSRFVFPEDQDLHYLNFNVLSETGGPHVWETRLARADGATVWARVEAAGAQAVDGALLCRAALSDITQRKHAEAQLRRANQYNRSLFEAALDPLVTIAPDGKITDANSATEKATGLSRHELAGTNFADYFTDPRKAREGYQQVFREGSVRDYELEIRHRDGSTAPVLYNATVYRDPAGNVDGVFASARDITERKRGEALRAYLASIVDSSEDAIIGKDLNSTVLSWNAGAEKLYGYSAAEMVGRPISLLTPPNRADETGHILERIKGGKSIDRYETERVRKDGKRIQVALTISPIRNPEGRIEGASAIARDITEPNRVRQELVNAHSRIIDILESISDGFNTFDREWRYTYVNRAAAKMVGKTPVELLGKNLWEQWPRAAESPFGAAYQRAVAENVPVQVEAFYPEPLNAWFEVRCYPSSEGLSVFFTDVTERRRVATAREDLLCELEVALAEKTVLLKEVHHRVKNNLAVISSLLSMRADATGSGEAKSALAESQQRVHSMALVHEHLYGSSHLDRINFFDYAQRLAADLYSAFLGETGRISIEMDVDPIEIEIDRAVPCALILNELMSNAFKYAFPERNGKVRISLHECQPGFLELAVEDNGIGLPAGRFNDSNSKSLGLRIVRILAKQLDGSLEQQVCSGTRIVLSFPVTSNPATP